MLAGPAASQGCIARDFLNEALPAAAADPAWIAAIRLAYPAVTVSQAEPGGARLTFAGRSVDAQPPTGRPAPERIAAATIEDQFAIAYPLSRDLDRRMDPAQDPGRARNGAFLRLLFGSDAGTVERALETVTFGPARFRVTGAHGVACQLKSAFADLAPHWDEIAPAFTQVGGGYAWRRIAGTDRLSAHSYGIAVDVNAALGGYWRWSGAKEGAVGAYDNRIPWRLVEAMERRGFIWGGKWHHFDGMHFEYRPELILFSRLTGGVGE
ncbi:hypothetical protein FIU97_10975 [Roseivivax sp. THAF40]|nr:hypothetical protein FIV09_10990 [Roseivivax sp. THAF197b]QFT47096.1 hypothetical protein FIU97_10975 [Roseivivax sp. THAF40]